MSDKNSETTGGPKLVLSNGQRVSLGLQGGSFAAMLAVLWSITSAANNFLHEAEETRAAVSTLGQRLDKVDDSIAHLVQNEKRTDDLSDEVQELRATMAQLKLEVAAALSCAKNKRKCP